jgi:serine-type D-Ala-D-Ala carboxypeptidase/endopeptidase
MHPIIFFVLLCNVCLGLAQVSAQPLSFSSDVGFIAKATLGVERGSVTVGAWRADRADYAFFENLRYKPAASLEALVKPLAADDQALYEIGSITKVFTGLLLAQAVERGELSLEDTLGRLLEAQVTLDSAALSAVTLKQLITHQSCLPRLPPGMLDNEASASAPADPYARFTRAQLWMSLRTLTFELKSPCPYLYSNLGLAIVGEILSERAGKPWHDMVKEAITEPLGMTDTVQALGNKASRLAPAFSHLYSAPAWDFKAMASAGALRSTTKDLLIFARALMAGNDGPLGAAAERLLTPLASIPEGEIGYAIFINGPKERRTYSHMGATGGYRSLWMFAPDSREALAVLTSSAQTEPGAVFARIIGARYPVSFSKFEIEPGKLAEFSGVYRLGPSRLINVVAQNGKLYVKSTNGGFRFLQAISQDSFADAELGFKYVFQRDAGKVASITLSQAGATQIASRTEDSAPVQAVVTLEAQQEYIGLFEGKRLLQRNMAFDVRGLHGQLAVRLNNQPRFLVYPVSGQPDRFYYDVVKAELQFERDSNGKVSGLTLFQNGGKYTTQRIAE